MPFVAGDKNINRKGRPGRSEKYMEDKPTNKEIRNKEFLALLRKVKPHVASAIMRAAEIMDNKQAAHQNQLRAAVILLQNYRQLLIDTYGDDVDPDASNEAPQADNRPIFSLTVIDGDKKEENTENKDN